MRQHHVAGEKAFVDYSGKRIGIADPTTGEIREAEIFVGVLSGPSNLTYAEATWTQTLPDWTGAHVRMFSLFRRRAEAAGSRHFKSGVNKASFYDREINHTYGAMAAHYSVESCRRGRGAPGQGKSRGRRQIRTDLHSGASAPSDVLLARRMQRGHHPRHQRMNERPMRNLGPSRRELFETIERDALIALPADDWEFAEWRRAGQSRLPHRDP